MTILDPRLWGAFLLAVVLSVGAGYWKGHHDADQSATVTAQAKQIKDLTADRDTYRQRAETQSGVANDAKQSADQARARALAADAESDSLRKRVADLIAAARRPSTPGGSTAADGGSDALDLLSGLFGRTDEAAGELARYADAAHIAGLACERSYDALRTSE